MATTAAQKADLTLKLKRTGQVFQIISTADAGFPITSLWNLVYAAEAFCFSLQTVDWGVLVDAAIKCLSEYKVFQNVREFALTLATEFV